MNNKNNFSPEGKMKELIILGLKRVFLIIVAFITYWQLFEYVSESPIITVYIENSIKEKDNYKTLISVKNGSESISLDDVIRPIKIVFNDTIIRLDSLKSQIKTSFKSQDNSLSIEFDLINKNEEFKFYVFTKLRPEIKSIDYRIKSIKNIKSYDYEKKPTPISRVLSIWIVLIILSILLLVDALLVILKDKEFGDIKAYINNFPLSSKNVEGFIKGYVEVYKTYTLRIKPDSKFMGEVIRNLFKSFPYSTKSDIEFIKFMANLKTELYTYYQVRTAFIVISPIVIIISTIAIFLNYFYFEIDTLKDLISVNQINKIILTILLIFALLVIMFSGKIMNLVFFKRSSRV